MKINIAGPLSMRDYATPLSKTSLWEKDCVRPRKQLAPMDTSDDSFGAIDFVRSMRGSDAVDMNRCQNFSQAGRAAAQRQRS
jgi:hypothetical protein